MARNVPALDESGAAGGVVRWVLERAFPGRAAELGACSPATGSRIGPSRMAGGAGDAAAGGLRPADGRGQARPTTGLYYVRRATDRWSSRAFFALPRHANGVGLVHGGMLSAFMDGVLAGRLARTGQRGVTIHLSIDFRTWRAGEWVMGEARMTRATRDVAFAEAAPTWAATTSWRCSGILLMNPAPRPSVCRRRKTPYRRAAGASGRSAVW